MAKREYPRNDNEYPEVMSKMDPLIIRVDPLVMVVGSTTYTAKVKIGYKFDGFLVHVSGVGIPIYKEVVDITGYNTGKTTTGEGSDAYKYVQDKARDWMDTLEKSMLDDNKEKNIVDLLREIKYQMHFDASGHKYPAIIEPGQPGYNPEKYDSRMEVCTEVPTYIEDLYAMLLKISIRLDNLTAVINGGNLKELHNDSVTYNQQTGKFDYSEDIQSSVTGLNKRIEDLNASIGTGKDEGDGKSLQTRISEIRSSIGDTSTGTVISKLTTIGDNVGTVATKVDTVASKVDLVASNSTTNATTISNAITNGLNQLVAQMTTMNGRIGTPSDTEASDTLFGYINKTKSAPILSTDPDVGMNADHVKWLNYWVQDMYDSGHGKLIDKFAPLLNDALVLGKSGGGYADSPVDQRGFYSINSNTWAIRVHVD